jgi:hypothetical protein
MKYKYNKENLIVTFNNLAEWAENLDAKSDKQVIDDTWKKLDSLMTEIQMDHDDIFGTEGYESTMMGKD